MFGDWLTSLVLSVLVMFSDVKRWMGKVLIPVDNIYDVPVRLADGRKIILLENSEFFLGT